MEISIMKMSPNICSISVVLHLEKSRDCDEKNEGLEWNKPYNCVKCVLRRPKSKDLDAYY